MRTRKQHRPFGNNLPVIGHRPPPWFTASREVRAEMSGRGGYAALAVGNVRELPFSRRQYRVLESGAWVRA